MPRARNGPVEIEYESFGDPQAPTILLVNGLGSQMTWTTGEFCETLVSRVFQVIRYDNRDTGLSTWPTQPYGIADMARDGVAVLDAAGAARAHVVGISMGGIIVQRMAIDHPGRIASMTSIMSTPSPAELVSTPEAHTALHSVPPDPEQDLEAYLAQMIRRSRIFESPAWPASDGELREKLLAAYRRAYNPDGAQRHMAAIGVDGDRTEGLRTLKIPALVIHGAEDPLVNPSAGRATANAIPGATLKIIPGMGHDLPPALYDVVADAIAAVAGA
jgi:pimeloyl-ACP methyl ester carboxylesterase